MHFNDKQPSYRNMQIFQLTNNLFRFSIFELNLTVKLPTYLHVQHFSLSYLSVQYLRIKHEQYLGERMYEEQTYTNGSIISIIWII